MWHRVFGTLLKECCGNKVFSVKMGLFLSLHSFKDTENESNDHRSCDCDLSNRKVSPKNIFGASTGFEPMASALALQCSTN